MIGEPPVCMWCKHFHRSRHWGCDAFPAGIPDEIWYHRNHHIQPFPGDRGIQFELDAQRYTEADLPADLRRSLRSRVGSR